MSMPPFGDPAMPPAGVPPMSAPAPNFGMPQQPAATMPAPSAVPPRPPMFTGQPPQMPQQGPDFAHAALPMIASAIMGRGNPALIGAGLAGYLKGRELRRAETESQEDRMRRRQLEQAKFYSDLVQSAQGYDDEAQLRSDLESVRPVADLYGVNVDMIHVSDAKKQAKARKDASGVLEQIRKSHGLSADDPAWQALHSSTINGARMTVAEIAKLAQAPTVMDQSGTAIAPTGAPFKADNPNEMKIAAYARDHGKRPEQLTSLEIQEALGEGKAPTATVGSFEDFVVRKFGRNPTPAQITAARKEYQQADDKPSDPVLGQIRDLTLANLQRGQSTMTPGQQSYARSLADDYTRDSKDYITRLQFYQQMQEASKDPSAAGDLVLIFSFMKMVDPGSTVRESEQASAQNAAGVPDQIRNTWNKILNGERLNPNQRADFVRQAQAQFTQAQTRQKGIYKIYSERAVRGKLNPDDVVIDYDKTFGLSGAPGADVAAGGAGRNPYR